MPMNFWRYKRVKDTIAIEIPEILLSIKLLFFRRKPHSKKLLFIIFKFKILLWTFSPTLIEMCNFKGHS
jgi:hypothetical protein